MKYKVVCNSPLLQYSLEYFLNGHLSNDGIIITDNPEINGILIGKDIKKPFSKTSLFIQLEKLSPKNDTTLEERVEKIFDRFKNEILEIIKEANGKEQY